MVSLNVEVLDDVLVQVDVVDLKVPSSFEDVAYASSTCTSWLKYGNVNGNVLRETKHSHTTMVSERK